PEKLVGFNLSPAEVAAAIRSQNAQVSSGTIGELPNVAGQAIFATVVVNGQLSNVDQFGAIVLRANPDGSAVRLRDVARIELGAQNYATSARLNGKPSTGSGPPGCGPTPPAGRCACATSRKSGPARRTTRPRRG